MKLFTCTCGQPLFFDNTHCLACGATVAYDPGSRTLAALEAVGDGTWTLARDARVPRPRLRTCEHRERAAACNWLVPADGPFTACLSCRLTRTIPNLARPRNAQRLGAIEAAKRRLLFTLQSWELPMDGLAFDILESIEGEPPILTGHAGGLITINAAEADDDYREQHREALNEPYRTVLGHLRHEIGHYYWNALVCGTPWHAPFRALFGDERADYAEALRRHYAEGPPADWSQRFISSYASVHPWEDWAETWAHYMHLRSTLQTVASLGLDTSHVRLAMTPFGADALYRAEPAAEGTRFLEWVNGWVVLTAVMNETARSMGQPDTYPFVLNRTAVAKLHFVQCVVDERTERAVPPILSTPGQAIP